MAGRKPSADKAKPPPRKRAPAPPPKPRRPTRAEVLRSDFDRLGRLLDMAEGSAAAAIARERRIIGELLERLEADVGEVPVVDQLASRRLARSGDSGPAARRRKPG
jgi:hypothetical protein